MEENRPKKILLMKIVVAILAIGILFIWVFNLKNVWRNEHQVPAVSDADSWLKLRNDLNKTLVDIQQQLSQMNKIGTSQGSSSSSDFLVNLAKNTKNYSSSSSVEIVATSTITTPPATSSLPSVNQLGNCPKYINCMPTVGLAHPCQIPVGCEGVTTLVY